jgi:predicted  nucleic acid-binding Zn-ribbon protein
MATETSLALQHLHHLLQQLDAAETLVAHGPRRIAAAQRKVQTAERCCVDQKDQIQAIRKSADQKSLTLKSREADIQKLTLRLNEASSNKEYEIITAQIAAEKSANEALEDEVLGLLTQVDEAVEKLESLKQEVEQAKAASAEIEQDVKAKEPGVTADISRLTEEIAEAESAIPAGDSLSTYRRLVQSHGPMALTEVKDGFCLACNTRITSQDVVRVNTGDFLLCRECGRILYASPD